jgi:hypothetical protein
MVQENADKAIPAAINSIANNDFLNWVSVTDMILKISLTFSPGCNYS